MLSELLPHILTFFMLTLLQAVLGFDNLLYISLESKKVSAEKAGMVRTTGIAIAVVLRIVLLFILISMLDLFKNSLFSLEFTDVVTANFNLHSLIVLAGGTFIMYTAVKEILHMMTLEEDMEDSGEKRTVFSAIFWIVVMNVVFSFDSILSAMALTKEFTVMAAAIIVGGILMIALSQKVSDFLMKNRLYEVLGLFILFIVGIMLLTEGGHIAHLKLFGQEIVPMSKTTFYFVISVLVLTDIVQSRYQKKLLRKRRV